MPEVRHSFVIREFVIRHFSTGGYRIRTCEGISHQIYSLTHLTALVTPRAIGRFSVGRSVSDAGLDIDRLRPNNTRGNSGPEATARGGPIIVQATRTLSLLTALIRKPPRRLRFR